MAVERPPRWFRVALFVALSAALIASAALFAGRGHSSKDRAPNRPARVKVLSSIAASPVRVSVLDRAAIAVAGRRFVAAFLRYEVGEVSPAITRRLRYWATARFGRELLRSPVRVGSRRPPAVAPITNLRVEALSRRPPAALVSGQARRGDGPEQFSFVFIRSQGRWRASAPGE